MNATYEKLGRAKEDRSPATEQRKSVPSFDSQVPYTHRTHVIEVVYVVGESDRGSAGCPGTDGFEIGTSGNAVGRVFHCLRKAIANVL